MGDIINEHQRRAKRVLRYGFQHPDKNIALVGKIFRHSFGVFNQCEKLLSEMGVPFKSRKHSELQMMESPFRIVALPLGENHSFLRGYRFSAMFIDDMTRLSQEQISTIILPFLSVTFDPIKRKERDELEDKLVSLGIFQENDRTKYDDPLLVDFSKA